MLYLPTQWAFCAISRTRRSWSLESLIYNRGQYGIIKSIPASDVFTTSILSSLLHSSQNSCKAWKSLIILKVLHWKKKLQGFYDNLLPLWKELKKGLTFSLLMLWMVWIAAVSAMKPSGCVSISYPVFWKGFWLS